ncbi:MAG: protein translocase subunit SecD [Polyangiaceae bacterium]|nr:protein translocase subunit SecD [Polyangiaceae bacterium]
MVDTYLKYGFAGAAALWLVLGYVLRPHRAAWWVAAACAGVSSVSAVYESFWMVVIGGLGMVWSLVCTRDIVDLSWRVKAGMTTAIALGAFLCLWPTLDEMSQGKIKCPQYLKERVEFRLVAGLDLRGGLRLVYTVDVEEAIKDKRDKYFDQIRSELATAYGFKAESKNASREDFEKVAEKVTVDKVKGSVTTITLKFKDAADVAKLDTDRFRQMAELVRQPGADASSSIFKIRTEVETQIRESAVSQAKDTVGRRVDELGLREASVTVRDEDIIVEVPGQDERAFKEIREIVSKTARLEFKMVDDTVDFMARYYKSDVVKDMPGLRFGKETAPVGPGKTNQITVAQLLKQPNETMKDARARMKQWIATLEVPSDHEVGLTVWRQTDADTGVEEEIGWQSMYLYSKTELVGDQVRDARVAQDQSRAATGGHLVELTFTEAGATHFEEITGSNIQKRFAIILDEVVQSAPRILGKIGGGRCTITMGSSDPAKQLAEAKKLELVLRAGALPAPITPSNEQRIGASLGTDAIRQGITGALAGAGLVLVFIAFYYRTAGLVADVAVIFNLFLQVALLATFGAAMTLPGIAGLALTVGMAIDANVLINERIREELRVGKSARAAVDIGYDKALSAIIDGHMTTFISGLILAQYGTGPIKGFAVTLLLGMVVSLFTSVVCTRLAFDWWVRGRKVKVLSVG